MDRVPRNQQEHQRISHQYKAFDWMHRKTGPRASVDVPVMPRMYVAIHEALVQNPVVRIEIETRPDRDKNDQGHKPDRVALKRDHGGPTVGISVPHKAFPKRPELHGNKRPKDIVPNLVFEPKRLGVFHHRSHIIAHFVALNAKAP